jgi:hypothetical protein
MPVEVVAVALEVKLGWPSTVEAAWPVLSALADSGTKASIKHAKAAPARDKPRRKNLQFPQSSNNLSFLSGRERQGVRRLERSYSRREWSLTYIKLSSELEGVRNDPSDLDLLKRLGLS